MLPHKQRDAAACLCTVAKTERSSSVILHGPSPAGPAAVRQNVKRQLRCKSDKSPDTRKTSGARAANLWDVDATCLCVCVYVCVCVWMGRRKREINKDSSETSPLQLFEQITVQQVHRSTCSLRCCTTCDVSIFLQLCSPFYCSNAQDLLCTIFKGFAKWVTTRC